MTSVPAETVLGALQWRYATKKFDPAKTIPEDIWTVLEQALVEANVRALDKDYVGAIGLYDQALANDPTLGTAVFYRGIAYRGHGDFDRALAELDATTVSTGQGSSSFNNGGNSLSPLHLPQGAVTVLLRPFPWEVDSPLQILASLEGLALAAFIVYRRKSVALSLRRMRSSPFLFYCWALTILYAVTFQAFANFGLLDRQRSLVLPALYVLLCLDHRRSREFDQDQRELAAARRAEFARGSI